HLHAEIGATAHLCGGSADESITLNLLPNDYENIENMYCCNDAIPRIRLRRKPGGENSGRRIRRSEEHTSELQSRENLVCRLLLEKKNGLGYSSFATDDVSVAADRLPADGITSLALHV